ncbi:MAG: hypothetical protein QXD13_02240 [Candidatus Pacearchaeota archaeon]
MARRKEDKTEIRERMELLKNGTDIVNSKNLYREERDEMIEEE